MGLAYRWVIVRMKTVGLLGGVVFGFTLAWARLTDPHVIRDMLLLNEPHVFLIMGSAVAIAAIGVRVLKASSARCIVVAGLLAGVTLQPMLAARKNVEADMPAAAATGL